MRYEPYQQEYASVPAMSDAELFDYFLSRVFENEEIWGLKEGGAYWMSYELDGHEVQPLFAYKRYAEEACVGDWEVLIPVAESLEYFLERSLNRLIEQNITLEIMPRKSAHGCLVAPQKLRSILEGMIDSGTYSMDG